MAATRFLVGVTLTFILAGQSIGKAIEQAPSEVEPNEAQSAELRQADRIPRAAMPKANSRMGMPKNFLASTSGINQGEDVAPKNPYRIISDARSARRLQAGRRGGGGNGFYSGAGSQNYPQPRYNSRTRIRHAGHRGLRPYGGGGVAPGSGGVPYQRHPFGPSGYGAGPGRRSFSPSSDTASFPGYYEN